MNNAKIFLLCLTENLEISHQEAPNFDSEQGFANDTFCPFV